MPLEEFVAKQSAWMSKLVERCAGLRLTISGAPAGATGGKPAWKGKRKDAPRKNAPRKAGGKTARRTAPSRPERT
ncbi:hypothetical protein D3C78_1162670 [compost metagenome]